MFIFVGLILYIRLKKIFKFLLNTIPRPWLIKLSYLARPVLTFLLQGSKFIDPIDGRGFRLFLPYGYGKQRNNVLSPSTLSLERHRLLWLYLMNKTNFFDATTRIKLLHFAPEQAFYQRFKNLKHVDYTTTDLVSPLADVKADICNLPFEDNSFDWIFCNHVLEHIPDDKQAMKELYRVMKPGGVGIFQVPLDTSRQHTFEDDTITNPTERAKIFGQYDHVRVYGLDFFERLAAVGFQVNALDYTAAMTSESIVKYGLAAGELIPICVKQSLV